MLEIWAQITLLGVGNSGSTDVTFSVLDGRGSEVQEAVWWMPEKGTAIIALGNSSDTAIHTSIQYSNGESQDVNIAPFATEYIRRKAGEGEEITSQAEGGAEAVKLITAGPAGSLRAVGVVTSNNRQFASSIRFYDPQAAVQANLFATNLRLKDALPRMVLRNTSSTSVSAQPRFRPTGGEDGRVVQLPALTLKPYDVVEVDLRPLINASMSRRDLNSVSVQVVSTGAPGSLIGALNSTDLENRISYDVPLRDSGRNRSLTGSYPWRVDRDYTTIVTISNVGEQPAKFHVDVRYAGGSYYLPPRELAIGETATFDLRQMQAEQKPDHKGSKIPQSLKSGQFHWSVAATPGAPKLIGRAEVVSVSKRVSSSYSCPVCCPDSGPFGGFNGGSPLLIDGFQARTASGEYIDCYSNVTYSGPLNMASIWVLNTNIASSSQSSGTSTMVHALGAGQTSLNGEWFTQDWDDDGMDCYPFHYNALAESPVQVEPNIDSITPARGLVGTSVNVTIEGKGFSSTDSLPDVELIAEGLEVTAFNVVNNLKITATFQIAINATLGNHAIKVRNGSQTSAAQNFFVQKPAKIVRQDFPIGATPAQESKGIGPLLTLTDGDIKNLSGVVVSSHRCGAYRNLYYQLVDQGGQPIEQEGINVTETFPADGYSGPSGFKPPDKTVPTNEKGHVDDVNAVSTPAGACLTADPNVTATQKWFVMIGSMRFDLSTVITIKFNFNPSTNQYTVSNSIATP
ncbi:MAG: IPT/TIG domain-containing protein [Pyrinomonadaceae bacterium]